MKTTGDQRVTGLFKRFISGSHFSTDLWNHKNEWLPADGVRMEEQHSRQENQKRTTSNSTRKHLNQVISMINNLTNEKCFLFTYYQESLTGSISKQVFLLNRLMLIVASYRSSWNKLWSQPQILNFSKFWTCPTPSTITTLNTSECYTLPC